MCGIAGFSLSNGEKVNPRRLTALLALGIENRGRDATGFAFIDNAGNIQVHKRDIPASLFTKGALSVPRDIDNVIIHTRFATQGDPIRNENNHPIRSGNIVGVHNGWVQNDWSLFLKNDVPRLAEVDSEVIFALMAHGDFKNPLDVLEEIDGPAAVAWLDEDRPEELHVARASSNPLVVAGTADGSFLFASTMSAIKSAAEATRLTIVWDEDLEEGDHLTVVGGIVTEFTHFKPRESIYTRRTTYGGTTVRTVAKGKSASDAVTKSYSDDFYENWGANNGVLNAGATEGGNDPDVTPVKATVVTPTRTNVLGTATNRSRFISEDLLDKSVAPIGRSAETYHRIYVNREEAIDGYLKAAADNGLLQQAFTEFHAGIRPGHYVDTYVMSDTREAEVISCPNSFPEGRYILRVVLPGGDVVIVGREYDEFTDRNESVASRMADAVGVFMDMD